jgi:PadR family transcriptional regulator PadR
MHHPGIVRPKSLIVAHLLLLLAEQPRHGYELAEALRLWEFEGVATSMVYRELARLEEAGLVQSFWQASQARGPARHMYDLTPAGREDLKVCAEDVRRLVSHLDGFLSQMSTICPAGGDGSAPVPAKGRRRFWKPVSR